MSTEGYNATHHERIRWAGGVARGRAGLEAAIDFATEEALGGADASRLVTVYNQAMARGQRRGEDPGRESTYPSGHTGWQTSAMPDFASLNEGRQTQEPSVRV